MSGYASRLSRAGGRFLDALAFLSRLAPPRPCNARSLAACVPWFAPAGLVLGSLYTLAAWLFLTLLSASPATMLFSGAVWPAAALAAWLWLALELWSARGLHWDGLADLGDACGSGATGARFWEILRDSRLGAFGALSLLLIFSGQWLALTWHLAAGHWLPLVLAPAWGRACAVWLAASAPPRAPKYRAACARSMPSGFSSRSGILGPMLICPPSFTRIKNRLSIQHPRFPVNAKHRIYFCLQLIAFASNLRYTVKKECDRYG